MCVFFTLVLAVTGLLLLHSIVAVAMGNGAVQGARHANLTRIAFPVEVGIVEFQHHRNRLVSVQDVINVIAGQWSIAEASEVGKMFSRIGWDDGGQKRFALHVVSSSVIKTVEPLVRLLHGILPYENLPSRAQVKCRGFPVIHQGEINPHFILLHNMDTATHVVVNYPNVWPLVFVKLDARHPYLQRRQSRIDDYKDEGKNPHDKAVLVAALVFFAFGLMLLCRTWWNVCFNLTPDSNVAIYVSLVLISAIFVWVGMALLGLRLGLISHNVRQVSNPAATGLVHLIPVIAEEKSIGQRVRHVDTEIGLMGPIRHVSIGDSPIHVDHFEVHSNQLKVVHNLTPFLLGIWIERRTLIPSEMIFGGWRNCPDFLKFIISAGAFYCRKYNVVRGFWPSRVNTESVAELSVKRWSLSSVPDNELDLERQLGIKLKDIKLLKSNPGPLVVPEGILSGFNVSFGGLHGIIRSVSRQSLSRRLGLNLSEHHIELPSIFSESGSGIFRSLSTGCCRFSHFRPLERGESRIGDQYHETENFEKHFWYSDYRLPCVIGFLFISVGWWDVKLGSQAWGSLVFMVGICSFFYGCILLMQSISDSM
jgi:hypothetical protein